MPVDTPSKSLDADATAVVKVDTRFGDTEVSTTDEIERDVL